MSWCMSVHPATLPRVLDKTVDVRGERRRTEQVFQLPDDIVEVAGTVAARQDLASARVELHHSFWREQHVGVLRAFPLQTQHRSQMGA
jgi:hypothetical protein